MYVRTYVAVETGRAQVSPTNWSKAVRPQWFQSLACIMPPTTSPCCPILSTLVFRGLRQLLCTLIKCFRYACFKTNAQEVNLSCWSIQTYTVVTWLSIYWETSAILFNEQSCVWKVETGALCTARVCSFCTLDLVWWLLRLLSVRSLMVCGVLCPPLVVHC